MTNFVSNQSISRKMVEFRTLGYTAASLRQICKRLAMEMEDPMWYRLPKFFF